MKLLIALALSAAASAQSSKFDLHGALTGNTDASARRQLQATTCVNETPSTVTQIKGVTGTGWQYGQQDPADSSNNCVLAATSGAGWLVSKTSYTVQVVTAYVKFSDYQKDVGLLLRAKDETPHANGAFPYESYLCKLATGVPGKAKLKLERKGQSCVSPRPCNDNANLAQTADFDFFEDTWYFMEATANGTTLDCKIEAVTGDLGSGLTTVSTTADDNTAGFEAGPAGIWDFGSREVEGVEYPHFWKDITINSETIMVPSALPAAAASNATYTEMTTCGENGDETLHKYDDRAGCCEDMNDDDLDTFINSIDAANPALVAACAHHSF